jgi:hypothetical protein
VSYDFYMHERKRVETDGVDGHFRLNGLGMELMEDLLDRQGVINRDEPGPVQPPTTLDYEDYDRAWALAHQRWHAEQEMRTRAAEKVRVPAVKFSTNDDWWVFPLECEVIAEALRGATVERCKEVINGNEDEVQALRAQVDGEPDFDVAARNFLLLATTFADYAARAAGYGGFRVS